MSNSPMTKSPLRKIEAPGALTSLKESPEKEHLDLSIYQKPGSFYDALVRPVFNGESYVPTPTSIFTLKQKRNKYDEESPFEYDNLNEK